MLTGPEKAVLFMLSLEEETSIRIVNELREADLHKLRAVASTMQQVDVSEVDALFREFLERSSQAVAVPRGGLPYLRRLTVSAMGEERAARVFEEGVTSPLARLEAAPPDAIAALLGNEPPQLAGAVLARLEPQTAAAVLAAMPTDRQNQVVRRIGSMAELPAGALEDIAAALANDLPSADADANISVDGVAKAAEILNAMARSDAKSLLERLQSEDEPIANEIRMAMFTFEDLRRLTPIAMRPLLREVPTERLTIALVGASDEVLRAVFAGLSARAAELIRDDRELLGHVPRKEIEAARLEITQLAVRLEAEGAIDLGRGGD